MTNADLIANIKTFKGMFVKSYRCIFNKKPLKSTRNRHVIILITCYNQIVAEFNNNDKILQLK